MLDSRRTGTPRQRRKYVKSNEKHKDYEGRGSMQLSVWDASAWSRRAGLLIHPILSPTEPSLQPSLPSTLSASLCVSVRTSLALFPHPPCPQTPAKSTVFIPSMPMRQKKHIRTACHLPLSKMLETLIQTFYTHTHTWAHTWLNSLGCGAVELKILHAFSLHPPLYTPHPSSFHHTEATQSHDKLEGLGCRSKPKLFTKWHTDGELWLRRTQTSTCKWKRTQTGKETVNLTRKHCHRWFLKCGTKKEIFIFAVPFSTPLMLVTQMQILFYSKTPWLYYRIQNRN